jgi:glycosyltransferase involved in cell wall biosynthesis
MHVALDTTPLLGDRTGIGHALAGVLDGFAALPDGERPEISRFVLSARALLGGRAARAAGRPVPFPAKVLHRLWADRGRPAIDRWIGSPDVVHGTNFVAPPVRRGVAVATVHDVWGLPEGIRRLIERTVLGGGWVHVPSEHVRAQVSDLFGTDRVRVVPWAVPALPEGGRLPAAVPDGPYVLFLGRDLPRKNVGVLVEAARRLHDLGLVLAGPGTEARGGLGTVTDDTRAALVRGAAVLAYPSEDEGFGLPVLEAMSVGVPVVAARAGAIPEVAGDAAVLVPPGDADALADGIRAALGDATLGARGRARAATFTWAATARGLIALYADAMATAAP